MRVLCAPSRSPGDHLVRAAHPTKAGPVRLHMNMTVARSGRANQAHVVVKVHNMRLGVVGMV